MCVLRGIMQCTSFRHDTCFIHVFSFALCAREKSLFITSFAAQYNEKCVIPT